MCNCRNKPLIVAILMAGSCALGVAQENATKKQVAKSKVSESSQKPIPTGKWRKLHTRNGIVVAARTIKDSEFPEYLVRGKVEASIDRLWEVICGIEDYPEFMPYVTETKVMKDDDTGKYVYQRISPPVGAERDFTMRIKIDKKTGKYVRHFCSCSDSGPKPINKVIRVECCTGSWTFERLDDDTSMISYQLHTDPGGSMPIWITKRANRTSLPGVVEAVRKRALNPAWSKTNRVATSD